MKINDIKLKMETLVLKWKNKTEPMEFTGAWFQRKADRIIYRDYKKLLKKINGKEVLTVDEQKAYCKEIGLI